MDRPTQGRLRATIEVLRQGSPNYDEMEPALRIAVRHSLEATRERLEHLGGIERISYEGQQQNADVYEVTFTNGPTIWIIGLAPDGRIATLWFNWNVGPPSPGVEPSSA